MASPQAKEAEEKAKAAAGKAFGAATSFLKSTPTGMLADAALKKGFGADYEEKAKKMAKQKAERFIEKGKETAMEQAERQIGKFGGGRKNRKKTRKNRFRKKKKSP